MARLHLLQGVVAYHLGRDKEVRLLLEEVATKLQLLAVDEAELMEIVSMGYTVAEARTGLRASLGDRKLAVDHIIRRREERAEVARKEKEERDRARLREELGRCANGNWVNVGYYNTLLEMGYNSFNTAVQMLQEEPDLIVLAAQEWDQEPSVVAMGFLLEMAAVALKNEGAVEKLTEVGGVVTPVDDGNDQKQSSKKARRDSKEKEADNRIKEGIAEGEENHMDFDLVEQGQFLQQYLSLLNLFEI